jgi:hypothetical protein
MTMIASRSTSPSQETSKGKNTLGQPLAPATLQAASKLSDLLLTQAENFREYRKALMRQREALLRNRVEELISANEAVETISTLLQENEDERMDWTRNLSELLEGKRMPRPFEGWLTRPDEEEDLPRCEDLAGKLNSEYGSALMSARQELRKALIGIDREQNLNTRLAENGRRLVHATLAALTHLDGRPGGSRLSTYSRTGTGTPTGGQARRLFNRKV